MQAIITKVLPATNTKPSRIKASCERGSLIVSGEELDERGHVRAALALCRSFVNADAMKYGEESVRSNPWGRPFVTGQLESGDYVHVTTGEKTKFDGLTEAARVFKNQLDSLIGFTERHGSAPFIDPRKSDAYQQAAAVLQSVSPV